jgi:hypothetical protein
MLVPAARGLCPCDSTSFPVLMGAEEADWRVIDASLARMSHVYRGPKPETMRAISR